MCTPWNYPMLEGEMLCDQFGAYCFDQTLTEASVDLSECHCYESCEVTRYPATVQRQDIMDDIYCQKDLMSTHYGHAIFQIMNKRGMVTYEDLPFSDENIEVCKTMIQTEIALVTVEMASATLTKSKREIRSTFADRLALVGNHTLLKSMTYSIGNCFFPSNRRNSRVIYWYEYSKHI